MIPRVAAPSVAAALLWCTLPVAAAGQSSDRPAHLRDRGPGVRTSVFSTYLPPHRWLVLPSVAYTSDHNLEYRPASLGFGSQQEDLRGKFHSSEAQLFVAYGVTDWLAFEVEASYIDARFTKSASDTSAPPAQIAEWGVADYAAQARLRIARERGRRPEIFAALEVTPPTQRTKRLIGDGQWNVKGEIGVARGFAFGTMTFRTTVEYNRGDKHWDLGESSLEYLRQLNPAWRVFLAIEGGENGALDEWTLVTAADWRIADGWFLKVANAAGLMSKSTDWEPQIGVLLELP